MVPLKYWILNTPTLIRRWWLTGTTAGAPFDGDCWRLMMAMKEIMMGSIEGDEIADRRRGEGVYIGVYVYGLCLIMERSVCRVCFSICVCEMSREK